MITKTDLNVVFISETGMNPDIHKKEYSNWIETRLLNNLNEREDFKRFEKSVDEEYIGRTING